jgi:hypothetical protein
MIAAMLAPGKKKNYQPWALAHECHAVCTAVDETLFLALAPAFSVDLSIIVA